MEYLIIVLILGLLVFFLSKQKNGNQNSTSSATFLAEWRPILEEKVSFYQKLSSDNKSKFEAQIAAFLENYKITGVETSINTTDRLLVAASGVIPIFHFPNWQYRNLKEILIYPSSFNIDFETEGKDRNVLGMVGEGAMKGSMILSQSALHDGFSNETDKKNTAIHEFVHLIDTMDGETDGVPSLLLEQPYVLPWLELMNQKMNDIYKNRSDINPYGGTNKAEFFAVASEYFFERPGLLSKKHPELYAMLEEIFDGQSDS